MKINKIIYSLVILLVFQSCATGYYTRKNFTYKKSVDTRDKEIDCQTKKLYHKGAIYADNRFPGARLNDFRQLNDSTYQVIISPENTPINPSPWYAFKIWSDVPDSIYLELKYQHAKHRYNPKTSKDYRTWLPVSKFSYNQDSTAIRFKLAVSPEKQWVAAQKIISSVDTRKWIDSLVAQHKISDVQNIGKSVLGRNIPFFRIGRGGLEHKKIIVLLSRQHPPEVTGFMALQSFIDELTKKNEVTQKFFKEYDIWVFPILNPDGVDLGHWRHNANGIDLNRDWAVYRQPEINAVTKLITQKLKEHHNKLVLGVDFHSTFKDVYYIFDDSFHSVLPNFNRYWTTSIDRIMVPFHTRLSPFGATQPISKNWFYKQFEAEAMTYEVGDNTPSDIIDKKARVAAITLMDLLLLRR